MTIRLTEVEVDSLSKMIRQFPEFSDFVDRWRTAEVNALVASSSQTWGLLQGRAQILTELQGLLRGRK